MTKQSDFAKDDSDRPVFEITQEMIEMGVHEAREHPLGAPLSDLVRKVFIAMLVEASAR